MIYLSPYYPVTLLHQDVQFVKQWRETTFAILSGDGIAEVDGLAKAMHARREARIQETDTAHSPEFIKTRAGKAAVYWILNPKQARRAVVAGAVVTDEEGNYSKERIPKTMAQRKESETTITAQCDYIDDRGVQCQSPPMPKSKYCRQHVNVSVMTSTHSSYLASRQGRYKNYLPERLAELYEEARNRPDLLEMEDQIAVLDAKLRTMMEEVDENMPSFHNMREWIKWLRDPELQEAGLSSLEEAVLKGIQQEAIWTRIHGTMEQQRKMVGTEIQRRKDLNLMIPVERVMALMGEVSDVVKRHVRDRETLGAIQRDIKNLSTLRYARPATGMVVDMGQV